MEPFAVNGRVDLEQLKALCSAEGEYSSLDYKEYCDLNDRKSRAEFVKDCAAMMSLPNGGYLVIGVDGHGKPVGASLSTSMFDSANLKAILTKYLEGEVPIASQLHHIQSAGDVAVIFLGRRADHLFPILKTDVGYVDDRGAEKVHLRAGDVIVRDGTTSRRWRTPDLPGLLKPLIDGIRVEEQARVGDLVAQLTRQQEGASIAKGAATNVTWRLPDDTFTQAILEMSRVGDERGLRIVLLMVTGEGKAFAQNVDIASQDFTDLLTVLDRLSACLGAAIVTGDTRLLDRAAASLHEIYRSVGSDGSPAWGSSSRIWLEIASRVLGAMALAVRLEEWAVITSLAIRPVGESYVYRSWLRHADVWANRTQQASHFVEEPKKIAGLLIAVARQRVAAIPALRPDRPGEDAPAKIGETPAEADALLDSLCQADFLWCVVAAAGGRGSNEQYPSFAALYDHRTRPIVQRLLQDSSVGSALLPTLDESDLDRVVTVVLDSATAQGHFWF